MLSLTLSTDERELLQDVLREVISELRMEIADTDSGDYRAMLHRREDMLKQLAARLATDVAAEPR
jgi:uncharacterized lipoprotein YmbA